MLAWAARCYVHMVARRCRAHFRPALTLKHACAWARQVNSLGTSLWTMSTTAVNSSVVSSAVALTQPAARDSAVVVAGWFKSAAATFGGGTHVLSSAADGARRSWDAFVFKVLLTRFQLRREAGDNRKALWWGR
jgi:hypothetical protein